MILLLGSSGYVGQAFAADLRSRGLPFASPSHSELDATSKDAVDQAVRALRPRFVVNAIGYTGRPNIDSTEQEKLRTLTANTVIPGILAEVLFEQNIPLGHVSSGCIFNGSLPDGQPFTEDDPPNFAFADPHASWYSRTKAMAEVLLQASPLSTIWRLRIPFDQFDHPRNYLTKIMRYERLLEATNSISQLQDFAHACIETLVRQVPSGTYNVTNPGSITTSEIVALIKKHRLCDKNFRFFHDEEEFLSSPNRVKRASCILSSDKIISIGIPLRDVHDAVDWSLKNWQ